MNLRFIKPRHKDLDESYHHKIKKEALKEISSDLRNGNFKIIESSYENDKAPQKTLFGYQVRSTQKEEIQVLTNKGLYIKISTEEI